jgi:hypothetical protein
VLGVFPAEAVTVDVALAWDPRKNHVTAVQHGPKVLPDGVPASEAALKRQLQCSAAQAAMTGIQEGSVDERQAAKRHRHAQVSRSDRSSAEPLEPETIGGSVGLSPFKDRPHNSEVSSSILSPDVSMYPEARAQPKAALTSFRRIAVAPDLQTSIVECRLDSCPMSAQRPSRLSLGIASFLISIS